MKSTHLSILTVLCTAVMPAAHAADNATGSTSGSAASLPPVFNPLVIIAPTEMRTEPALTRGCWARLFPQPDFRGPDDLTVAGPMEFPELHTPVGANWKQRTRSILVGPNATLTVFEGEKFAAKEATFKAGARIPDLRKQLPGVMAINSLRITCGSSGSTGGSSGDSSASSGASGNTSSSQSAGAPDTIPNNAAQTPAGKLIGPAPGPKALGIDPNSPPNSVPPDGPKTSR